MLLWEVVSKRAVIYAVMLVAVQGPIMSEVAEINEIFQGGRRKRITELKSYVSVR